LDSGIELALGEACSEGVVVPDAGVMPGSEDSFVVVTVVVP
jgi:hypothetical protein